MRMLRDAWQYSKRWNKNGYIHRKLKIAVIEDKMRYEVQECATETIKYDS